MSIRKMLALTSLLGLTISYGYFKGCEGALIERFPDVDRKIVQAIHREILLETLHGNYRHCQNTEDDEFWDALFLKKLHQRTST